MNRLLNALHRSRAFRDLTDQEFAWVLYDVGNSAFTMLACSLIPIWFKSLAIGNGPGQISSDRATAYYSITIAVVTVIVALLGPLMGALADRRGRKKIFFSTVTAIGAAGCLVNGFTASWRIFIAVYLITRIFYNASLTIYDSMLNDVTSGDRMDAVSSYGYAWGYIGSCFPFLVALAAYIAGPDMLGVLPGRLSMAIGFTVTAVWWILVALPLIRGYRQKNDSGDRSHAVREAFGSIFRTVKRIALHDRKVLLFLIAFFLYIDGVGTIIDNCINIGTDLNLNAVGQVIFLLATQVVAFAGSLVFARLTKKHGTVFLISVCIAGYFCVCLYALTLRTLLHFAILAFGVGCFQGSIQSLSRSYYSRIIPPEQSGEFFGIYDICGKGATCLGTAAVGIATQIFDDSNKGISVLSVFFLLGIIFFRIAVKAAKTEKK